jgi:hypothetical protein
MPFTNRPFVVNCVFVRTPGFPEGIAKVDSAEVHAGFAYGVWTPLGSKAMANQYDHDQQ